jgi:hypothetical protein
MPKLKNFDKVHKWAETETEKAIRGKAKDYVINELKKMLSRQVNAFGEKLPEKKESTKKSYKYKGFNTDDWFIATGRSTSRILSKNIPFGVKIYPIGKDILKYVGKKQSNKKGYAERWFSLNDNMIKKIIDIINKELET